MATKTKRSEAKKAASNKSRDGSDSDSDFELDLSGSQEGTQETNKFNLLCDSVHTCLALLNTALEEFYQIKDEILKHELPLKVLTTLALVAARIQRHHSELYAPVTALTKMVRLYSKSWDEKSAPLKKIKQDQASKQRQLDIALRKIEMFSVEEKRMTKERRVLNWEKLYAKLFNSKSQGYRWKFLIESFKTKINQGLAEFNPYMSGSDEESDEDLDDAVTKPFSMLESSEDELKDLPSDSDGEEKLQNRRSLSSSSLRNKSSRSSQSKRVRFADESSPEPDASSTNLPKSPYPVNTPPVESHDASVWTHEPKYDCHLLLCVYRPTSLAPEKELCCTFGIGSTFYTSQKFSKLRKKSSDIYQDFWFHLSKKEAQQFASLVPTLSGDKFLDDETSSHDPAPKLSIAVYANNISTNIIAMTTIPLKDLIINTDPYKVIPPSDRSEEFKMDQSEICAQLMTNDGTLFPAPYPLMGMGDDDDVGIIPLCCHLVLVEQLTQMDCTTTTTPLEELLEELGYRRTQEVCSRATSPIEVAEEAPAVESCEQAEEDNELTQEQYAALSLQHAEELKELQDQYEKKLESLSSTLAQLKKEKKKQESKLTAQEQAYQELQELYKAKASSRKSSQHRIVVRKKLANPHVGLPDWGSTVPDDFFDRMELFAQESYQRHEALARRIRREVSNACERQMASQHKLAQSVRTNFNNIMEDVSLPAILMPTKLGHVYSPRAHCYFHPTGTSEPRVTQAPAMFKLPVLKHKDKLTTMNLFDINELFCHSADPNWLKTSDQSPAFTPAPPSSALGFNNTNHPNTSPTLARKVK
ncbi:uncharacterized protein [Dysidea avara]|uniref:uncharacterized protein n=1 Tax=Dysidea avara TaxID=196820 RepID=UPI0033290C73